MMYCFQAHRQPWRQAEKITHKKTDRGRNKKRQETQARQAPTLSNGHVRLCPSLLILCKQMKLSPFCEGLIAWLEHGLNQKYRNAGRYQKKASEPRCNEKKCLYFTWQCVFKIAANYRPSSGHCQQQLRHLYCVTLMSWGGGWLSIKVQARRDTSSTEGEKEGGGEERGTEGGEGGERTNLLKPDKFGRDHCAYPTTAPHERYGSWAMTFTQQTQEMRFFFFFYSINSPDPTEKKNEKREEENEWDYPREGDEERDPGSECETPAAVETLHPMLFSKRSSSAFDGRCREVGEGWEREFMRTIKENWTARILVWQAM